MADEIDIESLKFQVEMIQDRIDDAGETIRSGVEEDLIQTVYYGLFEDSLDAAGYKVYLGEPENIIREHLRSAAHAAIVLFQYQGKTITRYYELPAFNERSFIDYSVTNPSVYVRAIYAAAVAEEKEILKGLLRIPLDKLLKGQETVTDDLGNFLRYLPAIIGQPAPFTPYPRETFWSIQQNTLKAVLETADPSAALKKLEEALAEYYSQEQFDLKAEKFLLLPVHGLAAIGKIKDML